MYIGKCGKLEQHNGPFKMSKNAASSPSPGLERKSKGLTPQDRSEGLRHNEEELRKSLSELADERTDPSLKAMNRISGGSNPFLDIVQDPKAATYKHGFLVRKVHADSDGKK
eukprot:g26026.t1